MQKEVKVTCLNCGKEKSLNGFNFYKSIIGASADTGEFYTTCKTCLNQMCMDEKNNIDLDKFKKVLDILGVEFNKEVLNQCISSEFKFGKYLRGVRLNNRKIDKIDFNSNVVEFLKREENLLREKADRVLRNGDFAMYIKIINAYETVVHLVKKYDWELRYSEYRIEGNKRQIAIWEENGDAQIRNHKVWDVK